MAYSTNDDAPVSVENKDKLRNSVELLPMYFRTEANRKFLGATVDALISKGQLERVNGYVGSRSAKSAKPTDVYVLEPTKNRRHYNFLPSATIKDPIYEKTKWTGTYDDLVNQLDFFGAKTNDHARLFESGYYAWDPHIDLDKFVNYRQYYWLPNGPSPVTVTGFLKGTTSTYSVSNQGSSSFVFTPNGFSTNPIVTLYRGATYRFDITSPGHPLFIKTARIHDKVTSLYSQGVQNNGADVGTIIFTVPDDAPDSLFYVCSEHQTMFGIFEIKNADEEYEINVEKEIVGKATYTSANGVAFSNGLKVRFLGTVVPTKYREKNWYVEGVGKAIKLIPEEDLETPEVYSQNFDFEYDVEDYDETPFDDVENYPTIPEYISINRSSIDKNPWSRYNRWFHKDVIEATARYNNTSIILDENFRAKRPIIEFKPNMQLFNHATVALGNVDLIDTQTLDAMSDVEGSVGYYCDEVLLNEGMRVVFNADTDITVKGKIYRVSFETHNGKRRLHLTEEDVPVEGQGIIVIDGENNQGSSWYFNGTAWVKGQQKTELNQAPLFELYDVNGVSFGDTTVYPVTDFIGNKLVSYRIGTGTDDVALGFPLTYQNINNVGDILFDFNWEKDTFSYKADASNVSIDTASGFVRVNNNLTSYEDQGAWKSVNKQLRQKILQVNDINTETNIIEVNVIDNPVNYINNIDIILEYADKIYKQNTDFSLLSSNEKLYIQTNNSIPAGTRITLRLDVDAVSNDSGHYEPPANLVNNGENNDLNSFTLGSVSDHFKTIFLNDTRVSGQLYGATNARDVYNIEDNGLRFLKHKGSVVNSIYNLVSKEHNVIKALRDSALKYNLFKEQFLTQAVTLELNGNVRENVDAILYSLSLNKNIKSPYYYTDMAGFGRSVSKIEYTVATVTQNVFGIAENYQTNTVSDRAVYVYLNEEHLIRDVDFEFDIVDNSITILRTLALGDKIVIMDYDTTGNVIPFTPTKLGLYPKFKPRTFTDSTYIEPKTVIEGHDGSITIAYNDFRDDLLLELEKRIYNNIKVDYNSNVFDINTHVPGAFRTTDYTHAEFASLLRNDFGYWANLYDVDYITNNSYVENNFFTYNYGRMIDDKNKQLLPAYWKGIYIKYFDTYRPHTCPWEMLGFSEKPRWWEDEYGPAPYTSGNDILWEDLEVGRIKDPAGHRMISTYARPGLSNYLPVDEYGDLRDPFATNIAQNYVSTAVENEWKFGDGAPAEHAWRTSSWYPYHLTVALILMKPAEYLGKLFDVAQNIIVNNNLLYKDSGKIFDLTDVKINDLSYNGTRYKGLGYHALITDYIKSVGSDVADYETNLKALSLNVVYKLGGFASKDRLRVLLGTNSPNAGNNSVFLPPENYELHLRTSNPIRSVKISGVIVEKVEDGYKVRGYDKYQPYFNTFKPIRQKTDVAVNIGGISADYVLWQENKFYAVGQLVEVDGFYYRCKETHTSGTAFDNSKFQRLPELPLTGGASVVKSKRFETKVTQVAYNTVYPKIQDVYDLLLGYGKWLESEGFIFDEYMPEIKEIQNWEFSGKEFLFWTTQGWALGSVITLAPFAEKLKFGFQNAQVDNVLDSFYEYSLLTARGLPLPTDRFTTVRQSGKFTIRTRDTVEGIYNAQLNLVQKEHVIVFDDRSVFGDVIYDQESGYRQERIKLSGFKTSEWDGDVYSPGFVFDEANITEWTPFVDYNLGDVIRYKSKYYSANQFTPGEETFNTDNWVYLGKKPVAQLYANLDYKADVFEDFYSLESENFDNEKTKLAQHLIGYQKRQYLDNLIQDETAQYKFYQGYIKEKGTKNAIDKVQRFSVNGITTDISYNEEWAFKLGSLGSYATIKEFEVALDERLNVENPQGYDFVNFRSTELTSSNVIKLLPSEIAVKATGYNNNPWPVYDINIENGNTVDSIQKLPVAGFPRIDDVDVTIFNHEEFLTSTAIANAREGDVIWVANDKDSTWNVYRVTGLTPRAVKEELTNDPALSLWTITTDSPHKLTTGKLISIRNFDNLIDGVYEVKAVLGLKSFAIEVPDTTITLSDDSSTGTLLEFVSVKVATTDEINDVQNIDEFNKSDKVWVENNGNDRWTVYEKTNAFVGNKFGSINTVANQEFGFNIETSESGRLIVVGAPQFGDEGEIYILRRQKSTGIATLEGTQGYAISENESDNIVTAPSPAVGFSISISPDETRIASGAPKAGNFKLMTDPERPGFNYNDNDVTVSAGILTDQGVVKLSKINTITNTYDYEYVIASQDPVNGEFFGTSVMLGNTKLVVGAPGRNGNTGRVYVFDYDSAIDGSTVDWHASIEQPYFELTSTDDVLDGKEGDQFGSCVRASKDMSILVVSAPGREVWSATGDSSKNTGQVFVYKLVNNEYTLIQTITEDDVGSAVADKFGHSIDISKDGTTIVVSAPYNDIEASNSGAVYYFRQNSAGTYDYVQTITSWQRGIEERFGMQVRVDATGSTLAVYSENGPSTVRTNFDTYNGYKYPTAIDETKYVLDSTSSATDFATTFDGGTIRFIDSAPSAGSVLTYSRVNTKFVFAQKLVAETLEQNDNFGRGLAFSNQSLMVGAPYNDNDGSQSGSLFVYDKTATAGWNASRVQDEYVNPWLVKKALTYDITKDTVKDFLEVLDPVKGKIPYLAEAEIRYKSDIDPAIYTVGDSGVNVNSSIAWAEDHVGEVWWDLSSVRYVWYEQGDTEYRSNNWGGLFPGSSIDVYEWVETDLLPSEWAEIADTTEGVALGFSGIPKYDDTVVAVKRIYNNNTNSFTSRYYYWVKNSVIVPAVDFRSLPCSEVANILSDPVAYGIKSLQLLSPSSMSVSNIKTTLNNDDIYLSVQYRELETDIPEHNEWMLMSEISSAKIDNELLLKKFVDSLTGFDDQGNHVPDVDLPPQRRYGIQIRPRQSMFKDRLAALKVIIDYVNEQMLKTRIVDTKNITALSDKDPQPSITTGKYDVKLNDFEDITNIGTQDLVQASISITLKNGRVEAVTIDEAGYGYRVAPAVEISGDGTGAKLTTTIDSEGRITDVEIIKTGKNYNYINSRIRPFKVLIDADETANGYWSMYEWNSVTGLWTRTNTQTYDLTRYWEYADYKVDGFDTDEVVNYKVSAPYELNTITPQTGDLIEVANAGDSNKMYLRKVTSNGSYNTEYDLLYKANSTIQFKSNIYDYSQLNFGFAGEENFDTNLFDETPIAETRAVVNVINDNIFVDDLKDQFNQMFFIAVRYALSEQGFVDWAFKTSFVTLKNNLGGFSKQSVYSEDNTSYIEDYIKEVKPYKTNIREYTLRYENLEDSRNGVTDFDLPSYWNEEEQRFEVVKITDDLVTQAPYNQWFDNYKFTVGGVSVSNAGDGYTQNPLVVISGGRETKPTITQTAEFRPLVTTDYDSTYFYVDTQSLPDHAFDQTFVLPQSFVFRIRKTPLVSIDKVQVPMGPMGVAVNGVVFFNPKANETEIRNGLEYTINAISQAHGLGIDDGSGHPQEDGVYHYHADPALMYEKDDSTHSPLLGYAFDGHPIYGPYGYANPNGNDKTVKVIESSYKLRTALRQDGSTPNGRYVEDFEYVAGSGDLDEYNGRECVTPEYPNGTYAYFVTVDPTTLEPAYPYIVGPNFYGVPELPNGEFDMPTTGYEDATAEAFIARGKLREIRVTNPGSGYVTAPTVTLIGGGNEGVTPGVAYANLANDKVRINKVDMKFDRLSKSKIIQTETTTDTFTASEGQIKFKLTYLPTLDKRDIDILVNNESLYVTDFDISIVTATDRTYKKQEGYLLLKSAPGRNASLTVTYKKNIGLMQATDRIDYYYEPTAGMLGKDPAQLMTGVEYDGVQVQGLEFNVSVGWDGLPWFSHGWDTFSGENTDYAFRADGSTQEFTLPYAPDVDQEVNIYFDGVRQDPTNTPTIVGDGNTQTFTLSVGAPDGTLVVFRPSTSDGSFVPTDVNNLDTLLSGGDFEGGDGSTRLFAYTSATGNNAEDISLDGDGFVTPDTSYAPEEVVPGQCFDSVAISVYNAPADGSPIIETVRYFGDSLTSTYSFNMLPGTNDSIFVTVGGVYKEQTTHYTLNYANKTVTFKSGHRPNIGELVTIQTLNVGGTKILERESFVGDGSTTEFEMTSRYDDVSTAFVTVNGIKRDYVLRESDNGSAIVDVENPPVASGDIIQVVALTSTEKTFSEIITDVFTYDGSSIDYKLSQIPGNIAPLHAMAIVELDGERLLPPDTIYYTSNGVTSQYSISQDPTFPVYSLALGELEVHLNGSKLIPIRDYNFDTANNLVTFNTGVLTAGDAIAITILRNHEYEIFTDVDPDDSTTYGYVKVLKAMSPSSKIKVTSFTNHDANLLRKEVFAGQTGGLYPLGRTALDSNYVWVEIDGVPLVADRDYKVVDSRNYVEVDNKFPQLPSSRVVIMSFSEDVSYDSIAYTMFEDMLHRHHFKRISKQDSTKLAQALNITDKEIVVEDASNLVEPSPANRVPGVIFIDKERIEYYVKDGNTLKQITRGTLGTGAKQQYVAGTAVIDAGPTQTIPYQDNINRYEIIIRDGLPNGRQEHVLETFTISSSAEAHDQVEVYLGGRKLQKPTLSTNPIKKHNIEIAFDSEEVNSEGTSSDVEQIPEFTVVPVDDSSAKGYYKLVLRDVPQDGVELKVIQRQGTLWYNRGVSTASNGETLQRSTSKEAQFLLERPSGLPVINIRE